MSAPDRRYKADLAKIHMGAKALGLEGDAYRAMLLAVGGAESAKDLSREGRLRVLRHLHKCGWEATPTKKRLRQARPAEEKRALAEKVRALLLDAGRDDAYADAIARRRFDTERWEWLGWDGLKKLAQMLIIDQRRREARG